MSRYILSVTAASMLVSILVTLAGNGTMAALVKLVAGVFLALTVISPLMKLELPDPESWFAVYAADGQAAAAAGEEIANDAARAIIKERTEAYILDKAARYGAVLEAEVALDAEGMPVSVTLTGVVTPYARTRLTREITAELGIGEEAQQWIS